MTVLIKIDRKSVKRNPNAGRTQTMVAGVVNTTLDVTFFIPMPEEIKKHVRVISYSHTFPVHSFVSRHQYQCVIDPKEDIQALITEIQKYTKDFNIIQNRPVQILDHDPEPEFLYDMETPDATCENCHETFSCTLLKSDGSSDPDDYSYSDEICPKCGYWDCCSFETEELSIDELSKIAAENQKSSQKT